jgi:signal recognition particle receptor subunit beta
VDVPGHPRIRAQFREYISDAKAIVFVVDASTISRNGLIVAEYVRPRVIYCTVLIVG